MPRIASTRIRWMAVSVSAGMLIVLLAVLFFQPAKRLDLVLSDLILAETRRAKGEEKFILVTLDEKSLNLAGALEPEEVQSSPALQAMQAGYPWSRTVYAEAARKMLDAGARVVIFDMLFPGPRNGDDEFAAVLSDYPGRIVLGSSFEQSSAAQNAGLTYQYTPPTEALAAAAGSVGFVNLPSHEGNIVRTMWPYATASVFSGHSSFPDEEIVPALSTAAALCLGRKVPVTFEPIRFPYAKFGFFRTAPLYELFVPALWQANYAGGEEFKDRIVLVGATAQYLQDYHHTPLGRIPGPVVQLHALAALLHGDQLKSSNLAVAILAVFLSALAALGLIVTRRNVFWFVVALLGGLLAWLLICAGVLSAFSFFLPVAPPLLTWLVCGFAGLACDVSLERMERGRLRGTLERYVSKDVVHEIVENPDSFLHTLVGQRKEIAVMFSDLKGFTSDSEKMDPAEMVTLLNEYFGEMVEVVFARQGTLDKFMGDALMATWGGIRAAEPHEDARNAVAAALEMRERLAAINVRRKARGAAPWGSGIGICQGPAIFGNIGSQQKMEPTVIGDTVNLASRFEGLTRVYACDILVNELVVANACGFCEFLPVDEVRVKGRKKPEKLFFPHPGTDLGWVEAFSAARKEYLEGNFTEAHAAFEKLTHGGLAPGLASRFMIRCEGFFRVLPEKGWTGVWDFLEK